MSVRLDELRQDLRFAARQITRKPSFTCLVVLTLALSIGANTAIFSVIEAVLLRPIEYPDSDRLVMIWERPPESPGAYNVINPRTAADWQDQAESFEGIALFHLASATSPDDRGAVRLAGASVTANYFSVLGVDPALGRGFSADEEGSRSQRVTVLSHDLWAQRFGADTSIVGNTVPLDGRNYTVVGIMPLGFKGPEHFFFGRTQFWVPIDFDMRGLPRDVGHWFRAIARLNRDVSVEGANAEMAAISGRLATAYPATNEGWGAVVVPLRDAVVRNVRPALLMLFAAVGLVLLIACVNVANLFLGRAVDRRAEFAIRCAMGAGRARLARQLLAESLSVSLAAAALGVLIADWAIPILLALAPALPRAGGVSVNGLVLAFALAVSIVTGLVFGSVPAVSAARTDVQQTLRSAGRGGTEPKEVRRLRALLIPVEVALSLVLLVGAGLFARSFGRLMAIDPGFRAEHVVIARVDLPQLSELPRAQRSVTLQEIQRRALGVPGVEKVGATSSLPLHGLNNVSFGLKLEDRAVQDAAEPPSAFYRAVTPGYFEAMGMTLRAGRLLSDEDRPDAPGAVLVNRVFAERYLPGQEPLGRRVAFHWAGLDFEGGIVGVVDGVRYNNLTEQPEAEIYVPYAQHPVQSPMFFAVRVSGNATGLIPPLREVLRSIDARLVVDEFTTMRRLVDGSVAQPRFNALLLAAASLTAIFLAAVGLYGVLSYSVSKRTREMGIRIALGADRGTVRRLVLVEGLQLVLVGIVVGITAAFVLSRFVSSLLYGVSTADPQVFVTAVLAVLAVAALAAYVPARRATRVDPVESLRRE
jgi:putative ABC transport system permease protein